MAVYKPVAGEAPLADFPDRTLALREVAAWEVADAGGWDQLPPTVLRDGPLGPGSVQAWVGGTLEGSGDGLADGVGGGSGDGLADGTDDGVPTDELLAAFPAREVPAGWIGVVLASTEDGEEVVIAHQDHPDLRSIAVLDVVLNNADRKGAHLLPDGDRVRGIDHGLSFHVLPKLRTVLWGFAGEPIGPQETDRLQRLAHRLQDKPTPALSALSAGERAALQQRVADLLERPVFPMPPRERYPLPWPLW